MTSLARRQQPPITIRSARAAELLRLLVRPGRSQAEVIEEALEQLATRGRTLADALMPRAAMDFDWEPPRSTLAALTVDLDE
ncbi:hypothetical protein AWL63_24300 (plasmid) [Sphingomonas panacis]|uniref:Uncharacterized protein n=1 Tax=Sphingomonas panacis TaxID=1560345 RepID=A0A1B3ZIL7_9SPHN|nr:hypothetical protein AWL63_24300 [Sphingomonas panacis]